MSLALPDPTVLTSAPVPSHPPRLTAAPEVDPPYDDEIAHLTLVPPALGTLPLPFEGDDPAGQHTATALRVLPGGRAAGPAEPAGRPRPEVRMFVQALSEVLCGTRPATQLTGSVSPGVLRALHHGSRWRMANGSPGPRPSLRSVHVSETGHDVLDVCAVVRRGQRHHALALRMRWRRNRWEATTVQVG